MVAALLPLVEGLFGRRDGERAAPEEAPTAAPRSPGAP
jgi:hypothetical protein